MLVMATRLPLTCESIITDEAENFLAPDQEENPARKESVSVGRRIACFVESFSTRSTDQPNSGRDAHQASDTWKTPCRVFCFLVHVVFQCKASSLNSNWLNVQVSPDIAKQSAML